jgi:hypothetical protein
MERGVVVGGLMICGSFLLAASLNRSAVKETRPATPASAEAPIDPPQPAAVPVDQPKSVTCAENANGSANPPVAGDEPVGGDLPGNGRKPCSR